MNERDIWKIIGANIPLLADVMVTIPKGTWMDVYSDTEGKNFSFSKPSGQADIKLFSMTAPNLEASYDVHLRNGRYFTGDDEEISRADLPRYLADCMKGMKDGGNEWGWEFKV